MGRTCRVSQSARPSRAGRGMVRSDWLEYKERPKGVRLLMCRPSVDVLHCREAVEEDVERTAGIQRQIPLLDTGGHRRSALKDERQTICLLNLAPDLAAPPLEPEGHPGPSRRKARGEADRRLPIGDARKTVDSGHPEPSQSPDMNAAADGCCCVGQVDG